MTNIGHLYRDGRGVEAEVAREKIADPIMVLSVNDQASSASPDERAASGTGPQPADRWLKAQNLRLDAAQNISRFPSEEIPLSPEPISRETASGLHV